MNTMKIKNKLFCVLFCSVVIIPVIYGPQNLFASVSSRRNDVVKAVEKVNATVVSISTERLMVKRSMDPLFGFRSELFDGFFNDFFDSFEQKNVEIPLGSGVIIDEDGHIITNEHVISRASKIKIILADKTEFVANLVSSDPVNDLALVKIESKTPLPFIKIGNSKDLMIGESVIALGNPFGLGNSVTTGVLSALDRTLNFGDTKVNLEYKNLIQTDALINQGNSGGPLVNIDGELIGINTAILSKAQGIGFAIPVDKVKQILVRMFNFRELNKVWLGIEVEDTKPDMAGIEIVKVEEESPASDSGLETGDIITKIDDQNINDVLDYEKYMLKKDVNDTIRITLLRFMIEKTVSVKLAITPVPSTDKLAKDKIGVHVQELTPAIAKQLGIVSSKMGVLISEVDKDGPADEIKILSGYVIVRINQYRITNLEDLGIILSKVYKGDMLEIGLLWADANGEHRGNGRVKVR